MDGTCVILGLVDSQPVGLDPKYYEAVYQEHYKPLLSVLNQFSGIPVSLYISAFYLEWLEAKHPEALMLLGDLVKRKQLEMLGGAFFEPILSVIPNTDRNSQIEEMTTFLRRRFNRRPRGGWLSEMIWEPNIPVFLKNSGIEYTFLEESFFKIAGLKGEDFYYPVITEDQGKAITVFPLDTESQKFFLENTPEESFAFFSNKIKVLGKRELPDARKTLCLFFDCQDWQGKNLSAWLEGFLPLLSGQNGDFSLQHPELCVKTPQVFKKIYFPSLVPGKMFPDRKKNPKHGTSRTLLEIYPEINLLYSKQIYVGLLINQYRGDKSRKKTARQDLCRVQNNRLYWYPQGQEASFRVMRQEAYKALLIAETQVREAGIFKPHILPYDFELNGLDEYLYQGQVYNAYVSLEGGRLFELDYLEKPWNYQDTHCHWMVPAGNRDSFIDAFYTDEEHPRKSPNPLGGFSLGSQLYRERELNNDEHKISLELETRIPDLAGKRRPIVIHKDYSFKKNYLSVSYEIINPSALELDFHFSSELNLSFSSQGNELSMDYLSRGKVKDGAFDRDGHYRDLKLIEIKDTKNKTALTLSASKSCELVIATRKIDDPQWGALYQGTSFLFNWKKKLEGQKSWTVEISVKLEKLSQPSASP